MIIGSTCSGIMSDAVAWGGLGWKHAWCAEFAPPEASPSERALSKFNQRLIAERYPSIMNLGDFTKIGAEHAGIDLLVGGTPCQDFSVAGLRAGMDGARGALALEFLLLARRLAPRWIVWENVPGVLHASGGRAMGAFLGGLAELGYGFAYRVLDAQFFGLAQRRKRVFVVACAGGQQQRAAAVLLERASMRWDPPPSGEARADVAGCLEARARSGGHDPGAHGAATGHLVVGTLKKRADVPSIEGAASGQVIPIQEPMAARGDQGGSGVSRDGEPMYTMVRAHAHGAAILPFDTTQITHAENHSRPEDGDPAPSLAKGAHPPAVAFHQTQDPISGDVSPALSRTSMGMGMGMGASVRRLTPTECERLMGFPDGYTKIKGAKDGHRYAALGNSIAVPVLRWIGERIARVEEIGR